MDEGTKKGAIQKLDLMASLVAYPKELLNNNKLNEFYKKYVIDKKSAIKTELNFNRVMIERSLQSLDEPVDPLDWTGIFGGASTTNAFYSPTSNSISLCTLLEFYTSSFIHYNFM